MNYLYYILTVYLIIPQWFAEQYNGYQKGSSAFYSRWVVHNGDTIWVTSLNSADSSEFAELFEGVATDTLTLEPSDFPQSLDTIF